jgi:hypothetical protein
LPRKIAADRDTLVNDQSEKFDSAIGSRSRYVGLRVLTLSCLLGGGTGFFFLETTIGWGGGVGASATTTGFGANSVRDGGGGGWSEFSPAGSFDTGVAIRTGTKAGT